MGRKKLTLSIDERLTNRAKATAKQRGTSVSRLVETFFKTLKGGSPAEEEHSETSDDTSSNYEPSEWATRWRGAFAEEETAYPDDPAWDEEHIERAIREKHIS
jgi:hypothetical protein